MGKKASTQAGTRWANAGLVVVAALVALPFVPLFVWSFTGEWRFPDLLPSAWSSRGLFYLLEPGGAVVGATLHSLVIGGRRRWPRWSSGCRRG